MALDAAANWVQILSVVVPAVLAVVGLIARHTIRAVVREVTKQLQVATAPIQKGANGGWSLPDAIRLLQKMDERMDKIDRQVSHLAGRFEQHMVEGDHK